MTTAAPLPSREPLSLLKLHGMGNDFLVLVDLDGRQPIDAGMARALCDRHRGIGADGLIRAVRPSVPDSRPAGRGNGDGGGSSAAVVSMELLNADGGPAETSGNGLRCLALALVLTGAAEGDSVGPDAVGPHAVGAVDPASPVPAPAGAPHRQFVIETVVGPRLARVGPVAPDGSAPVSVGMGAARLQGETEVSGHRAERVDLGNPHLVVLVEDPDAVDLEIEGRAEELRHPGGINVNYAVVTGADQVKLRTWERGAGATLACGSGSCATAAALRGWGLVGDRVEVLNPGGPVTVSFESDAIVLTGPAQLIGTVLVDAAALAARDGASSSASRSDAVRVGTNA